MFLKKKRRVKRRENKFVVDVLKPAVYAEDAQDLACKVMMERGLNPDDCVIQVGLDDGQNMVKVMMTIKDKVLIS